MTRLRQKEVMCSLKKEPGDLVEETEAFRRHLRHLRQDPAVDIAAN